MIWNHPLFLDTSIYKRDDPTIPLKLLSTNHLLWDLPRSLSPPSVVRLHHILWVELQTLEEVHQINCCVLEGNSQAGWWFQSLQKTWKSVGMILPNILAKIKDIPNHQPARKVFTSDIARCPWGYTDILYVPWNWSAMKPAKMSGIFFHGPFELNNN